MVKHSLPENKRKRGQETIQKLLGIIAGSEPAGKTAGELVTETGLDRDYIRLICNDLVSKALIVRSGGKFGKYHLTPKTLNEDPGLNAFLFATKIREQFNRLGNGAICGKSLFCNNDFCKQTFDMADKDENNPEQPVDELYFFEFALRLGAIVMYQLIQSIRYSDDGLQKHSSYNYDVSSTLKNEYIFKYIENAVTPVFLINVFRNWYPIHRRLKPESEGIQEVITNEEGATKVQQQNLKSLFPSILELREGQLNEIQVIFKNTFPDLFKELETIRTVEVQEQIDWRKHSVDEKLRKITELEKEDPDHTKCGGELLSDIRTNNKGKKVQKCSKCYRWIEFKRTKRKTKNDPFG